MILDYIESSEYIVARVTFNCNGPMVISDEEIESIANAIHPAESETEIRFLADRVTPVVRPAICQYWSVFDNYLIDYDHHLVSEGEQCIRGAIVFLANRMRIHTYDDIDHKKLSKMAEVITQGRYAAIDYTAFWLKQLAIPHPNWNVPLIGARQFILNSFVLFVLPPDSELEVPDTVKIGDRVYEKSAFIRSQMAYKYFGSEKELFFEVRFNRKYYSFINMPLYTPSYQEYINEIIRAYHLDVSERRKRDVDFTD